MPCLHLPHHFFVTIVPPIRQCSCQQHLDVVTAQQWMRIGLTQARLEHELRGHHHQGHMPMPGLPLPGLVLRHPDMALGILECSLDPEALCLHPRQFRSARLSWGVA
jgi:hypothetical protein